MSLINDVLRQVDNRNKIKDEISSFLPVALIPKKNNRDISRWLLIVASVLLILIYVFHLVVNKPLFNNVVIPPPIVTDFTPPVDIDDAYIDLTLNLSGDDLFQEPKAIHVSERLVAYVEPVIIAPVTKSRISNDQAAKPKAKVSRDHVIPAKTDVSIVKEISIKRSKNKSESEKGYQSALGYFINGNIERSNAIIKQVLLESSSEEYLSLQARIFLKKKDANSFYDLVKTHPENNSLAWYKLIAPGLQLFSYYHLSNQYYYALINIEPEQIRWQLAVALNHLRLGKEDKAIAIYRDLSQSSQVSSRQKQWLIRKIERLTLSKA